MHSSTHKHFMQCSPLKYWYVCTHQTVNKLLQTATVHYQYTNIYLSIKHLCGCLPWTTGTYVLTSSKASYITQLLYTTNIYVLVYPWNTSHKTSPEHRQYISMGYRNWYQYWGHCCLINNLGSSPQPEGEALGLCWASQVVNETSMTEIEVSFSMLSWWN